MILTLAVAALIAQASPAVSASPSPSPSPSAPSDPCGSILSIVNRPTVTTGVCTVRPGSFDVETGYTNTTATGPGGGSAVIFPQALVRAMDGDRFAAICAKWRADR